MKERKVENIFYWVDGDRFKVQIVYNIGMNNVRTVKSLEEIKELEKTYNVKAEKVN